METKKKCRTTGKIYGSTFYLGEGKLDYHPSLQNFPTIFTDVNFKIYFSKEKNKNTANLCCLNLVLNEANSAYLDVSGTAALPTSCQMHKFSHSSPHNFYWRFGRECLSNCCFLKTPTCIHIPSQQFHLSPSKFSAV
jgi:hypothetical protein